MLHTYLHKRKPYGIKLLFSHVNVTVLREDWRRVNISTCYQWSSASLPTATLTLQQIRTALNHTETQAL